MSSSYTNIYICARLSSMGLLGPGTWWCPWSIPGTTWDVHSCPGTDGTSWTWDLVVSMEHAMEGQPGMSMVVLGQVGHLSMPGTTWDVHGCPGTGGTHEHVWDNLGCPCLS